MFSKRSREGYLMIDNRANGLRSGLPVGAGPGTLFEAPTCTCSHCQRVVVMRPDRTRARAWCPKCDHYICDHCEAARVASGGVCMPFSQVADEIQNKAVKAPLLLAS